MVPPHCHWSLLLLFDYSLRSDAVISSDYTVPKYVWIARSKGSRRKQCWSNLKKKNSVYVHWKCDLTQNSTAIGGVSTVKPTRCTIFRVYWISLDMFRTVFPSIIRNSRLYIQHQVYVQSRTPDDGRKDRPKHVKWYSINSKNCASSWFYCRNISRCTVPWHINLRGYLL